MMWYEKYLIYAYKDFNCAGLLKKVWQDELGIDLNINCNIVDNIDKQNEIFKNIQYANKIDVPIDKCAVIMYSRAGTIGHVGVYVDIRDGFILHAHKDFKSAILQPKKDVYTLNPFYAYYSYD
ncbi:MAG TPA: hypothetical protein VN698_03390 [Bacteroidia bacterium]|nr:hypothetical protein [Bacteroidia bacterium]